MPNVDTNKPKKETKQQPQPLERNVIDKDVLDANNPKVKAIYAKALKILKAFKISYSIGANGGVYVAYGDGIRADELL